MLPELLCFLPIFDLQDELAFPLGLQRTVRIATDSFIFVDTGQFGDNTFNLPPECFSPELIIIQSILKITQVKLGYFEPIQTGHFDFDLLGCDT